MSSGMVQMFCHIVDDVGCYGRVILLPFILFVVPCGTYLNNDEDIDVLVEFYWNCLGSHYLLLIGFFMAIVLFI